MTTEQLVVIPSWKATLVLNYTVDTKGNIQTITAAIPEISRKGETVSPSVVYKRTLTVAS